MEQTRTGWSRSVKNGAADVDDRGERESGECGYSLKDQSIGKKHKEKTLL